MKNKKLTYLLGLVVAVVWGLIIYRVIVASGGSDDNLPVVAKTAVKEPYDDDKPPKDTIHLLLNYRDPFGLVQFKDTTRASANKRTVTNRTVAPIFDWSFIKYSGYIRNPGSKKLIAIMSINGESVTMAEGETADKVKLIKNMRDSVKVSFNGRSHFIVNR